MALDGGSIVGCTGVVPFGACQLTVAQRLVMFPSLVGLGHRSLSRVGRWTGEWAALDLEQPHSHLGPLAVDAHLRGRGIGSQILREYCRRLDRDQSIGYLETETEENVRLYARFGFRVVAERRVLGLPNWFMQRPAGAGLTG